MPRGAQLLATNIACSTTAVLFQTPTDIHHARHQAAQIGGGILGSTLAIVLIPDHLQRSFAGFGLGVRPGVHLWQGLVCELALALILNVIVLWSFSAANAYVAYWTLMGATLVLVVAGAELTGPSMNPAIVRRGCAMRMITNTLSAHRASGGFSTFRGIHCWSTCLCFGWRRWQAECLLGWCGERWRASPLKRLQNAKRLENDILGNAIALAQ